MTKQLLCVSAGVMLFGVTSAYAQVTTSSVNGTIIDGKTKETLIGASVVVKHLPTGTTYGAATNHKGNFIIQGLRPGGPYEVTVSYVGYKTVKLNNISLSLGEAETFNVSLIDDNQIAEVVVTGTKGAAFNANRTGASSNFNRKAIDRTPTVDRSLFDIAKLSPQATVSSNGAVSFAGSNNRFNSFQIDGAVSNDVFGLSSSGTNGGQAGTTPISIEAIDALQVVIAPFDVRQSGFTGGGINAITKSGTNDLKGSAYAFYKNQDFFGKTAGRENEGKRTSLSTQYEYTVGATLGGAIIKNKLFYFVNAEYTNETFPSRYLPGDGSRITDATAKSIENKLIDLTGHNGGGYAKRDIPRNSFKALARIDWNINAKHRLSLRYSYLDAKKFSFSNTATALYFLDRGFDFSSNTNSIVAELNSRLSNSVSNEFRFGYTRIRDSRDTYGTPTPSIEVIEGNNRIYLGQDNSSIANSLDQDVYTLTDNLTWATGNHTFTFGTHNELFTMSNLFMQNVNGYYSFNSVEDFLSQGTATAALPVGYRYTFSNVAGQSRWAPTFSAAQLGFYAQDEWKATDNLRLTYGLRVDLPLFLDTPTANAKFNASGIATSNGVQNHDMPKTTPLISPRIGFRYTLGEAKKHLLRGGVGIFTGRIPFVWISNSFGNTGVELTQINYSNAAAVQAASGFAFNIDPSKQYPYNPEAVAAGVTPKTALNTINLVSKNFKFPQTFRANLAFETKLPGDIKMVLEGVYNKNFNNIFYRNLNIKATGNTVTDPLLGADRPTYAKIDKTQGDVIYLENSDKGHSYNLSASLSKDFNFGLSASVSYTYGKSLGAIDGTSSVAYSNWAYAYTYAGQNKEEVSYTTFDTRHRIVANLNYRVEYGKHFATTIGLIYNGQTGNRFSMVYNGDANSDGVRGNDLMYVPTADEINSMNFVPNTVKSHNKTYSVAEQRAGLEALIAGNKELSEYRGQFIPRNALVAPFLHKIDLHFAQDFFFNVGKRRHTIQLNADVMNFANMLNPNWGVSYSAGWSQSPLAYSNGQYKFTPYTGKIWNIQDIDSRWKAQVGIKYIF